MMKFISICVLAGIILQGANANGSASCVGNHEFFNNCGTACPLTCQNHEHPPPCNRKCVRGCFCEEGYVRNSRGACIPKSKCPKCSPPLCNYPNEQYNACGSPCPITCRNCKNPPKNCVSQCAAGCFCESPYLRNSKGRCVLQSQCN